ncbi:hypothetical protein [Mycolicibacterium bacteremicum]|uniref:Uncharacterized protein n=1 Tax=Mycolicibacterium bacteremicum TaxID=564198 RepID=A0A1W9YVG8_MYCBA|nr:hypothetical protein [Mycolicibacterium bacteremicum]MCV7434267.1 hypothetical protein [Mycolicibacterium bacteremicum]ORA04054.1 hypothetical protein BST17_16365 [Mycolicibacterium bacteremicum]
MKKISGTAVAYGGYVFFIVGFISLGLFVTALAVGSASALVCAIVSVASFAAAVAGFRIGARRFGSVWAKPVTDDDLRVYKARYRGRSRRGRVGRSSTRAA